MKKSGWAVYLLILSMMFIAISHLNHQRNEQIKFCKMSIMECK